MLNDYFPARGYLEYPVGDASFYLPVTLDPDFTVGGSVVVRVPTQVTTRTSTTLGDPNKSVNRNWTITNVSLTFSQCDVLFNWNASDVDGPASRPASSWQKDGSWTHPPVSVDPGTSLSVLDLTSFSEFQIGEAATIPSYRSAISGNWSSIGTWESNDGSGWQPASVVPDGSNSASINILNGHTRSINGGDRISADELVVDLGGVLELTTGSLLLDGTGDLQVNGTMTLAEFAHRNGTATIQTTGTLELQNNTTLAGAGTIGFDDDETMGRTGALSTSVRAFRVYNNSEITLSSTALDFRTSWRTTMFNGANLYLSEQYCGKFSRGLHLAGHRHWSVPFQIRGGPVGTWNCLD